MTMLADLSITPEETSSNQIEKGVRRSREREGREGRGREGPVTPMRSFTVDGRLTLHKH